MSTLLYFEFPSDGPFGQEAAAAYADLAGFGITDITAQEFTVNEQLSATTRAVLSR